MRMYRAKRTADGSPVAIGFEDMGYRKEHGGFTARFTLDGQEVFSVVTVKEMSRALDGPQLRETADLATLSAHGIDIYEIYDAP